MSPADAASRAWLAIVRKGYGTRAIADALVEAFDVVSYTGPATGFDGIALKAEQRKRNDWQEVVTTYRRTASWSPFCAAACARFDLVP